MIGGALSGWPRSFAAELPWLDPDWLQAHVGEGEGQIAPVVLQRARALYLKKVSEGAVNNPCYFAMDATRPGGLGRRFYVICEADRTFRAVPSGHGDGRNLEGVADFANGIRCAKNFSNAINSQGVSPAREDQQYGKITAASACGTVGEAAGEALAQTRGG